MLIRKNAKIYIYIFIFITFFSKNLIAEISYFECPEKISKILISENFNFKEGDEIGLNLIKIENKNQNNKLSIQYKNNKNKKFEEKIKSKIAKNSSLGFTINNNKSKSNSNFEENYSFIKVNNTYAFTKKIFYWSRNDKDNQITKYEYIATSRCKKINKNTYLTSLKIDEPKKKKAKIIKKEKNKQNLKGNRIFALSWEGYDDLMLGTLSFDEQNLVGKINFELSKNHGECFGTYVLSKIKGTWSILCDYNNMNASGTLVWNDTTGEVKGIGKDEKNKRVKFTVKKPD
tara:strand:+ start:1229 stop:2092 length:864 start_codon:yes stop_codon:yes gene_type:complete